MAAKINIDKEVFTEQVLSGYSIPELQKYWGCGKGTIVSRKKEFGLIGNSPNSKKRDNGDGTKICNTCLLEKPIAEFYSNGYYKDQLKLKGSCIPCENKQRIKNHYSRIIKILAEQNREYACEICGYKKNHSALAFHHFLDQKNFEINAGKTFSKERLYKEIELCKLLCQNCHHEVHNPDLNITEEFVT